MAESGGYGLVPNADGAMRFSPDGEARPLWAVRPGAMEALGLSENVAAWARDTGFAAKVGEVLPLPGEEGVSGALIGLGPKDGRTRFAAAPARARLPEGVWRLASDHDAAERDEIALAWLFAGYSFGRYKEAKPPEAALLAPEGCDAARLEAIAEGERITRWLIDTPAGDAGPAEIAAAALALAAAHGAEARVVKGEKLTRDFPLIAAVGAAAAVGREPRVEPVQHDARLHRDRARRGV